MSRLQEWICRAVSELDLSYKVSPLIDLEEGKRVQPLVLLEGIGSPNGMLIFTDVAQVRDMHFPLSAAGYGYTVLSEPRRDEDFDLASFREMFEDWRNNL